jgi:hypothetical protein
VDRDTFDLTIRTFKHRNPFRPFTVAMGNGDQLEIDHPEALAVNHGVAVYIGTAGIISMFDHEGVSRVIGDLASKTANDMS